jgi:hypothetical protein
MAFGLAGERMWKKSQVNREADAGDEKDKENGRKSDT